MIPKIVILVAIVIKILHTEAVRVVINLPDGKIRGTTFENLNNLTYYGFQGIPFAAPPVGNLRFEAPQPPKPWSGILDATKESSTCIVYGGFSLNADKKSLKTDQVSEDCLYLNVYTPTLKPKEKLPVMVWIYGGAFELGNSLKRRFNPDYLMEKDVIFVSFNYRVGPLGFLATGDTALPGNMGIKDQYMALLWTYKNIEFFGGDPSKITIFGQSAGAASVGLHVLSKKAAGLFRAAILESASALEYWSVDWNPKATAYKVADAILGGNYGNDTQSLKEFLKSRSLEEINKAYEAIPGVNSYPSIEVEHEGAYITQNHMEAFINGEFNQVPIIIGICSKEGLTFKAGGTVDLVTKAAQAFDKDPASLIPTDLRQNASDTEDVIKAIQDIYLKEGQKFVDNLVGVVDYVSDDSFARAILKQAELQAKYVPVYLYKFGYMGRQSQGKPFIDGVGHSGELPFLFNYLHTDDPNDILTQNRMVTLWTNFARFLNPTPEPLELLENKVWPVTTPEKFQYFNISSTIEVLQDLENITYKKWNHLYERYGKKPLITF